MLTPERLAEYEYKAGYLNGLHWDTEGDCLDVKTLINHCRAQLTEISEKDKQIAELTKEVEFLRAVREFLRD